MKKLNKKLLWEAVKEPLRLLVLAVLPFLVVYFNDLPYEWAGAAILVLRAIDKFLHLIGKESKDSRLTGGLTRF